ncbi:MAG: hypothetical protein GY832_14550 [Chloroflexi bacterium]|nr:hypothetical protein [Chloroflexota bacterium]
MNDQKSSRVNQILDLLVEEIEERLRGREKSVPLTEPPDALPPKPVESRVLQSFTSSPTAQEEISLESQGGVSKRHPLDPEPAMEPELPPFSPGPSHAARLMGRLALGLLIAIVLINIPFNRHGTTLATALPDSAALVVLDGLVVKEKNDEKIYVYEDEQFRWISSMDTFEHFHFTWGDVHIVEDGYLDRFEIGSPIHVLLKCNASPHIYRLEDGEKRWIRDIETFDAEGHKWTNVRFVSCGYLRGLPDGETIPPDSGPPPQP